MKGAIFSDSRAKSLHSEMLHERRSCAEERYNTPRLFRRRRQLICKPVMNACGRCHPAMKNKIKEISRTV